SAGWFSSSGWQLHPLECAHGWTPCAIVQRTARTPARRQNGPRSGAHLGTNAATARSAKAEIAESEYCSRFPELLCSPEGLMHLIPQFNVNGQFTIPNPNTDLQIFLLAQQGLSNAIDMILAQENISQNPSNVGSLPSRPLIFASNWLSSEVGIQTDGTKL